MIYAAVMLFDGSSQKSRPEIFSAAAFGVVFFLPYLAQRQPTQKVVATPPLKFLDTRWLKIAIGLGAIGFLTYGITQENWSDFISAWQTQRFIHMMSLDFVMLSALFPVLAKDDLSRRNGQYWLWWLTWIPMLGAIVYLYLRPRQFFVDATTPI